MGYNNVSGWVAVLFGLLDGEMEIWIGARYWFGVL